MSIKFLVSLVLAIHPVLHHNETRGCARTYTVAMGIRAIDATYQSGRSATPAEEARLRMMSAASATVQLSPT